MENKIINSKIKEMLQEMCSTIPCNKCRFLCFHNEKDCELRDADRHVPLQREWDYFSTILGNEDGGKSMEGTGIIRRVDDLGRIMLPKGIRKEAGIEEGTPMELLISEEGILLRKYRPINNLESTLQKMELQLNDMKEDASTENNKKFSDIQKHLLEIKKIIKE